MCVQAKQWHHAQTSRGMIFFDALVFTVAAVSCKLYSLGFEFPRNLVDLTQMRGVQLWCNKTGTGCARGGEFSLKFLLKCQYLEHAAIDVASGRLANMNMQSKYLLLKNKQGYIICIENCYHVSRQHLHKEVKQKFSQTNVYILFETYNCFCNVRSPPSSSSIQRNPILLSRQSNSDN